MSATTNSGDSRQLVIFELCHEQYALPIEHVQEIIRYTEPRSVASENPWVKGVINLRSKIVPVCDLAARIGARVDDQPVSNIVIIETPEGTAGLMVSQVSEVLTVPCSQIEPTPSTSDRALGNIAKIDERLVVLLDPSALLTGMSVNDV